MGFAILSFAFSEFSGANSFPFLSRTVLGQRKMANRRHVKLTRSPKALVLTTLTSFLNRRTQMTLTSCQPTAKQTLTLRCPQFGHRIFEISKGFKKETKVVVIKLVLLSYFNSVIFEKSNVSSFGYF
jgi:hypothetical protein